MAGNQPHSFAAKLASLAPGESLFLPEVYDPQESRPLRLERATQTAMARSRALTGRRFSTSRAVCVLQSPLRPLQGLVITRES